jgi:hypothetical protein
MNPVMQEANKMELTTVMRVGSVSGLMPTEPIYNSKKKKKKKKEELACLDHERKPHYCVFKSAFPLKAQKKIIVLQLITSNLITS